MKPTVVIAYPGFGDIDIEREILGRIDVNVEHVGTLDTEEAREAASRADVLMVTIQPVPADLIERMDRCRLICRVGTGLDAIDIPAATARGIWVTYAPDYSIDEVSTHAIALVLAQARGLPGFFSTTRQGIWDAQAGGVLRRLSEQTLGVIGCGRIGQATASKGRGVGLNVLVFDPYADAAVIAELGVRLVDLETLLRDSDYISLHSPLTKRDEPPDQRGDAGADETDRVSGECGARRAGRRRGAAGCSARRADRGRGAGRPRRRAGSVGPPLFAGRTDLVDAARRVVLRGIEG